MTNESRIEEIDFSPRVPVVRLILTGLAFGVLGWAFANETWFEFQLAGRLALRDLIEAIGISLLLLVSFCFITSFLLLQFRLKFSEVGIRRLTLFAPRFIKWDSIRSASVWSYKGYVCLELRVSRCRWVCVPLLEYGKGARLFREMKKRVPIEIHVSEKQLAVLSDS